jgi:hypothetical protein
LGQIAHFPDTAAQLVCVFWRDPGHDATPVMNTPEFPTDELFEVERRIARRADELARQHGTDRSRALDHWRQAEREIWRDAGCGATDTPRR